MSQYPSPFLRLPVEIRLQIYNLVLPYSEYNINIQNSRKDSPVTWYPGNGSILFVNRQIYRETVEILYRENFFSLFVRHPVEPRLPINDSRADAESFILISWWKKSWASPKNPRLPLSLLKRHSNFQNVRYLHVSLPPFDGLLGHDVYFQKTSYAAFNGINAWVRQCIKNECRIDDRDRERMLYISGYKAPIDELGLLLQALPVIERIYVSLPDIERQVGFASYMVKQLFLLRNIKFAMAFYVFRFSARPRPWSGGPPDLDLLGDLKTRMEDPSYKAEESHLPTDMDNMFGLLQSIREKQQRDPGSVPQWIVPMPE
ncbi:hypothetical protein ACLMJK_000318 [Lecanora helva]